MSYSNPVPDLEEISDGISKENEPDYVQMKEVYFAFIDVLGFKKTFDDIKISKKPNGTDKYREVFNYYFDLMNAAKFMEEGKSTGCYAGQTSDSLYFYTERADYLMKFIKIYSHFSLYAMSKDVFFRGGIAKGSLYKKKKYQFYGDSVIGAYLMESSISKNPIITVDEKTHSDMCEITEYNDFVDTCQERHYIKPFELLDKSMVLDIDETFILKEIDRIQIQHYIQENKNTFEYNDSVYGKYAFLSEQLKNSNKIPQ